MCIKLKISVVSQDEKEKGLRRILNFGHTYAHAIENITGYKKYTHGECVAAGLLFAIEAAYKTRKIDKEYYFLSKDIIKKFGFINIPKFPVDKILESIKLDKKSDNSGINFIIPVEYAKVDCIKYSQEELREFL